MPNFVSGSSGIVYPCDKTKISLKDKHHHSPPPSQSLHHTKGLIEHGDSVVKVGSFDPGDPTTTNLYIGNVHPSVNEDDLCDLFITFGPLASVKIMWPRKDEERARNRNSGFVAFMTRPAAEEAYKTVNGFNLNGYELRIGWAKAIAIPQNPISYHPRSIDKAVRIPPVGFVARHNIDASDSLSSQDKEFLTSIILNLDTTREKIGDAMMFCIQHSNAAKEIVELICQFLVQNEATLRQKLARLFLISDILHNCSALVTNASYYRQGFYDKLASSFEHLNYYMTNHLDTNQKRDKLKQKVLVVLGAWKEWTLYEDDFVIHLSNLFFGLTTNSKKQFTSPSDCPALPTDSKDFAPTDPTYIEQRDKSASEISLDGEPIGEETLSKCLETKGLSLRWYKALNLSDEALDQHHSNSVVVETKPDVESKRQPVGASQSIKKDESQRVLEDRVKFRASKWEIVDPGEVSDQPANLPKLSSDAQALVENSRPESIVVGGPDLPTNESSPDQFGSRHES